MNMRLLVHTTVLGIALVLVGTHLHGQPGAPPTRFQTVKVKDDLYVFNNPGAPGNITAYITNEGVILIDAKNPVDYDNIVAAVKAVTNQPIRYLVNTHHHNDHTGSNPQIQKSGAVVIASENARQNMIESKFQGQPTVTIEQRANVILGGKKVELYYFGRGHTNGDIVAYFPADRTLATGDLYVTGDGTPELVDYAAGGSAKEWTKSVDGLLGLDFDVAIPGHGVVATKDDVRRFRDLTVSLRNRVAEMLKNKATPEDVEKMLRTEFHWGNLHVFRGLTGIMAEMREMP
jgi:glyoxylase-like metal-dependent hydrolase (beta-lactamase superfamily II)